MYAANPLALATAITAAVAFCLGAGVALRGRGARGSILFSLITASAAAWLGCFALMYSSLSPHVALLWARAGHVAAALIPAIILNFVSVYTGTRQRLRVRLGLSWFFCITVALIGAASPILIPAVRHYSWGWYANGSPLNFIWAATYGLILLYAMRLLWNAHQQSEGQTRERTGLMLLALAVGSLALVDVFPSMGIDMYPVGYMAVLAFSIVAARAVWNYEVIDLTPEFAAGQILETMKGAVLVVDMDGKIRVVNRAAGAMLGFDAPTMVGLHIRNIIQRNEATSTAQILESTGVLEQTMLWRTADGSALDVLAQSSFVRQADGTPVAAIYVATDYTERKRAEEALRESETRYRTLFDANPLPMWVYDFDTLRFIAVNDAAIAHYGYLREEFMEMTILDIRPQEDLPQMEEALRNPPEKRDRALFRHRIRSGKIIDVEITSFEFLFGEKRSRLVIAQDVTERRGAEERLRESEERYRNVVELSPDAIFVHQEGKLTFVNTAAVRLIGAASAEELVGRDIMTLVHPDYRTTVRSRLRVLSRGREVPLIEEKFLKRDGTAVDVEVAAISFQIDGKPAIQVVARDISERKAIEASLRQSETRYRDLFENANDIVYTHDLEGRITSMNLAGLRTTGYTLDEALSMTIQQFIAPDDVERAASNFRRKVADETHTTSYEIDLQAKDGRRIPVEVNTRLVFRDGKSIGVQGIARDVTERKSNEARFRLLFERILACNDAMARIFGYDSNEELMRVASALDLYFEPDDRKRYLQALQEQGSLTNVERRMKRRDGSPVWVLENVAVLDGNVIEGTIIDITDRKTATFSRTHTGE